VKARCGVSSAIRAKCVPPLPACSSTKTFTTDSSINSFPARKKLRLGNPLDSASQMGPQISGRQMDRVLDYIESGKNDGARVLCGGDAISTAKSPKAFSSSRPSSAT
jgi:hypothetical protein